MKTRPWLKQKAMLNAPLWSGRAIIERENEISCKKFYNQNLLQIVERYRTTIHLLADVSYETELH